MAGTTNRSLRSDAKIGFARCANIWAGEAWGAIRRLLASDRTHPECGVCEATSPGLLSPLDFQPDFAFPGARRPHDDGLMPALANPSSRRC